MIEGRSITLDVRYRTTPYSAQAVAQGAVGAGGGTSGGSEAVAAAGYAAGAQVTLNKTPLYYASTSTSPAVYKTGTYYLYDGIIIRGRLRITNTKSRVGKTPVGKNVTGWANAADLGISPASGGEDTKTGSIAPPTDEGAESGTDISGSVESLTYTDCAADNSDSVDIKVNAEDPRWLGDWMPKKGTTLAPRAQGHHWDREGDERELSCGLFVVDDINYSDTPSSMTVGGVSKPSDTNFDQQAKTVTWKNTTIKRIGETIAKRYGLGFTFEGTDYAIDGDEQSGSDSNHYHNLCKKYGLVLKVYARRMWVYDREAYKAKAAVMTIDRTDIKRGSFQWKTSLTGEYTGGQFSYTDPDTNVDIKCSVGGGSHIRTVNQRATSVADAAVMLCAELNNANHGTTSIKFSLPGAWGLSAATNINLTGYGALDGKYFVDKVTHKFTRSGGYQADVECSLVTEGFHTWQVGGSLKTSASAQTAATMAATTTSTEAADSAASAAAGAVAGGAVTLSGAKLYVSATAKDPAGTKSGTYYFYDGILVSGRYRITNTAARCGKLPVGQNVTGWVNAEDCGIGAGGGGAAAGAITQIAAGGTSTR